ncbi:hypothetical protein E4P39_13540 [Blastococcus sp. CT_GayMR19]|uniref:hypothetical protein n=1 Tax=Blastococcus sp. CT_GayMR19 TaxID=2559608 RepID=UPI00107394DA|nr:hypothetical protein [Blastococcus sp. CT_GayMR19]TFV73789.1 hypothetical protein E4P39_13540 [Blastococcus sp. CT_GayMR19]
MSLSTTPATARTDVAAPRTTPAAPVSTGLTRRVGIAVTTGSVAWAAGMAAFTNTPTAGTVQHYVYEVTALMFQLGLVALVWLQLRTGATGTGKLARGFLHAEHVLLGLAITSTFTWMFLRDYQETGWFMALDVFWPLSMLGMAAIGVRIAIAGRWKGAARFWPMVAESWAPVAVPASFLVPAFAQYVGAAHLLIGYVLLGVILARRPELTGARD